MINPNRYPKGFSKSIPADYSKKICIKSKNIVSSRLSLSEKWRDLTWPLKGPKFNLHHLRETFMAFKMAVLTPKSGIRGYS